MSLYPPTELFKLFYKNAWGWGGGDNNFFKKLINIQDTISTQKWRGNWVWEKYIFLKIYYFILFLNLNK